MLAAGVLLLAGCGLGGSARRQAAAPPAGLERVRVGMSAGQVREAAGEPLEAEGGASAGSAVWYYEDGVVILRRDTVRFCYPNPAS
jgi:hypothetical protein